MSTIRFVIDAPASMHFYRLDNGVIRNLSSAILAKSKFCNTLAMTNVRQNVFMIKTSGRGRR